MTKNFTHPSITNITLAEILNALGDAARLQIARNLYRTSQPLTCTQAVQNIANLPLSTRSHCFKVLREGGIIRSDKQGRECYNTLRLSEIEQTYPGLLKAVLGGHNRATPAGD